MATSWQRLLVYLVVGCIAVLFAPCIKADSVKYTYDKAGRLVRAEYVGGGVIEYTYDEAGNRLSRKVTESTGAAGLDVEPRSHDFGSVRVGSQSAPRRFTVNSAGTGNLVIGTVSITGDGANSFMKASDDCSGQTVAPANSCTLDVVFKPSTLGTKTATLSVPSNDPEGGPDVATLTGNGVAVPTPGACVGDCNGGGNVTVDELILCVNIALGNQPVGSCRNCDPGGDGVVTVDELVRAVNAALSDCDRAGTLTRSR